MTNPEKEFMDIESKIAPGTPYSKIVEYGELLDIVHKEQERGLKVVMTTGIYDIVHFKHAESLACVRKFGDIVVVGIPDDEEVIKASTAGRQSKDNLGPIIDFERRAKMISHLPYVSLVFKKSRNKQTLVEEIKPDVLIQSITSGVGVINEVLDLTNVFESRVSKGNLIFSLGDRECEVIFIDDLIGGETEVVSLGGVVEATKVWERDKFSEGRFHGSIIKRKIIERATHEKK